MENDKLIYELVQRNVEFAGNQLSDNLWFNSIVLTDVLYQNLYKLLEGKFNESDFVDWTAQELLKRGCVYKGNDQQEKKEPGKNQSEPEVVVELDTSSYDDLIQKIYQSIELLKSNRLTIFKLFSDVDNQIQHIGEEQGSQIQVSRELLAKRDEKLKEWIDRLQYNQDIVDNYLVQHAQGKDELSSALKQVQMRVDGIQKNPKAKNNFTIVKKSNGVSIIESLRKKIQLGFRTTLEKIEKKLDNKQNPERKDEISDKDLVLPPKFEEEIQKESKVSQETKTKGETTT